MHSQLSPDEIRSFQQERGLNVTGSLDVATERALEDDAAVVLASRRRFERVPGCDARPFTEQIDVAGMVHLIDEVRAARAAADLAEDGLALRRIEPLHVREAAAHAEGAEHLPTEREALLDLRLLQVAHRDDDGADPFVRARLERLR